MQRRANYLLLLVVLLLTWSCQQATQPVDVTSTRTLSVQVVEVDGTPIANAMVDWQKLSGPSSPVGGQTRTTQRGIAQVAVPDVATTRDLVSLLVTLPQQPDYAGIDPIEWRDSICTDTSITIVITPVIPCGTLTITDTIDVAICPSTGTTSANECRYYPTTCASGLVFVAQPATNSDIRLELTSSGTPSSMLHVCATYAPPSSTPSGTNVAMTSTIVGTYPGNATEQVRLVLTVLARVDCDECDCPATQDANENLGRICVGTATDTTVALSTLMRPLALDDGCVAEFTLERNTSGDVVVNGSGFSVRGGQAFPDLGVTITPSVLGRSTATLRYRVRTRNQRTGVVRDCPTPVVVTVEYEGVQGSCSVAGFPLDTLEKCVFNDQVPQDTFSIVNNGDCPITVNIGSSNPLFTPSPSGDVVVPARGRVAISVSFAATKRDWDRNPAVPRGTRGDKDFSGEIIVVGCGGQTQRYPVSGIAYVQCDAFKYQCLRQFRPTGYENVYAESIELADQKTIITYQNDNQTFKVFDIYVDSIAADGSVTLATGTNPNSGRAYGGFYRVTTGFSILPGQNICDTYPAAAAQLCGDIKSGAVTTTSQLAGLRQGDVILFVKNGSTGMQCALIWIQSVGPDRPGPISLDQVCIEICYPVFTI
ncbi:MAG: hypothetical protein FGM24_08650 [Candidatus Kapabacteria bacterium]|nr:hypothetical protein [Candidatus Kapabacteria bacterium]